MLIVIDVQPAWEASWKVLPGVLTAIRNAKKALKPITILEYSDDAFQHYGASVPQVRQAVKKYPHHLVKKSRDDGSDALVDALGSFKDCEVQLCGINTCACVVSTAYGLTAKGAKVSIILSAVACGYTHHPNPQWCINSNWSSTLIKPTFLP